MPPSPFSSYIFLSSCIVFWIFYCFDKNLFNTERKTIWFCIFLCPHLCFGMSSQKKVKRPQRYFPRPLYISSLLCTPLFVCYLPSYLSFQRSLSSLRGFTGRRSSYKVTAFDQISMRSFPLYIFMLLAWSLRFCELTQERLAWLACPFQHPQSYYFGLDK